MTEHELASAYRGKTVLITGDTGFKGSWLAVWLTHLGARVIGYALPPKTGRDNFVRCRLGEKITHIDGDVRDGERLHRTFSTYRPDIAFHLAAQALVLDSFDDPGYTYGTNVMGTVNFFEAVRSTDSVRAAINVTSDKCYENQERTHGYRETDRLGGKDPYSASKAASEIITSSYRQSFFGPASAAHIASVRAGNVIGGGDWAAHRIVPDCVRALLDGRPIVIRNPAAVRPWQHVLDPLYGYLLLGARLFTEGDRYAGPWNFGPMSGNMITVEQLAKTVIRHWGGGRFVIEEGTCSDRETNILHLDASKAVSLLGWQPLLAVDDAVKLALDEYRIESGNGDGVFGQRIEHIERYAALACGGKR